MEGLTISKIDGDKIEVTTRPLASGPQVLFRYLGSRSEAKVGQKVKGIVMSTLKAAGCLDGAPMSPGWRRRLLRRRLQQRRPGAEEPAQRLGIDGSTGGYGVEASPWTNTRPKRQAKGREVSGPGQEADLVITQVDGDRVSVSDRSPEELWPKPRPWQRLARTSRNSCPPSYAGRTSPGRCGREGSSV